MKAVLFGNADIGDYGFCKKYIEDAVVICCDGGMRHALKLGLTPDYIVGDFDSVTPDVLDYYKKQNIALKQVPCRKDETDMELGIRHAYEIGADTVIVMGGIGSRMDHTLANIFQLLKIDELGMKGIVVNENNAISLCKDKTVVEGEKGDTVSFIPITKEVTGVCTEGLEYPLSNETMYMNSPRGVSNVMEGNTASYSIKDGLALVIVARD